MERPTSDTIAVGTVHLPDVRTVASRRLMSFVRSCFDRKMVGEDQNLTSRYKVDLTRLPPCQSALMSHVQRINHREAFYKRANEATLEKPTPYDDGQRWMKTDEGALEPVWSCGPIMPTSLVDLLVSFEREVEDEERTDEEIDDIDLDGFIDSDDDCWLICYELHKLCRGRARSGRGERRIQ